MFGDSFCPSTYLAALKFEQSFTIWKIFFVVFGMFGTIMTNVDKEWLIKYK